MFPPGGTGRNPQDAFVTDLFREAALNEQRQKLHGAIILDNRLPVTLAVWAMCIVALLALVLFFTVGFARKEIVGGQILPKQGLVEVTAGMSGLVAERRVREGEAVNAGDVLFVISGERSTARGDTQAKIDAGLDQRKDSVQQELRQGERQLRLQRDSIAARLGDLRRQIGHMDTEIDLQTRRSAMADEARRQYEALAAAQDVSVVLARDKAAEAIDQRSRLQAMKRERAALDAQIAQLRAEQSDVSLRIEREGLSLKRTLSALDQEGAENEARREVLVRASRAGTVSSIVAEPGQSVAAGQTLASVVPAGATMEAVLLVPTRAVGMVRAGAPVELRYDAFPFEKYGQFKGTVREVSSTPMPESEARRVASQSGEGGAGPMYRLRVELERATVPIPGGEAPLLAGMRLQASLTLEYRRLYQWAFEPVAGLTGKPL